MMLGGQIVKKSLSVRDSYTLEGLKNVNFSSIDILITDSGIPDSYRQRIEEEGVKVIIA